MLQNRKHYGKNEPQDVINGYKKRQQFLPFIIGILAVVLL